MKLYSPFLKNYISQPFSKNYNTYYAEGGYKGHTGIDMVAIGDPTILASAPGYVYSLMNKDNPDVMRYRAVYTLVEDTEEGLWYEVSYGHCNEIYAKVGSFVQVGDKLGIMGNTGDVSVGGNKVTAEQKRLYPNMGAHLHFQVRLVKPVDKTVKGTYYLTNSEGPVRYAGKYYEMVNYFNGFAGCIDPAPFMIQAEPRIISVLRYGSRGEQVKILQKKLNIKVDGVFGIQTEGAVKKFQRANGLVVDGIVGPKTNASLSSTK